MHKRKYFQIKYNEQKWTLFIGQGVSFLNIAVWLPKKARFEYYFTEGPICYCNYFEKHVSIFDQVVVELYFVWVNVLCIDFICEYKEPCFIQWIMYGRIKWLRYSNKRRVEDF